VFRFIHPDLPSRVHLWSQGPRKNTTVKQLQSSIWQHFEISTAKHLTTRLHQNNVVVHNHHAGSNLPAIGKEPLPEDKTHLPADEAKLPEPVLHLPPIKRVYEPKIKRAVMPTEVKPQPRQVKRQEKKMMAMEEKEENWRGALLKLKKIRSKTNDSLRKLKVSESVMSWWVKCELFNIT